MRGLTSIRSYKLRDKEFVDIISKYDIVLLVETWTNEFCELNLPGYEYTAS